MHRRLLAVLAATTLACSTPREEVRATESAPRLAAADSSFTPGVGTAVVELPEAGGFLVDGQPASQDSIPVLLAARFAAAGEHHAWSWCGTIPRAGLTRSGSRGPRLARADGSSTTS